MAHTYKKGIRFRDASSCTAKQTWIVQGAAATAAFFALMYMLLELTGFGAVCNLRAMLLTGIGICFIYAYLMKLQWQHVFSLGIITILLLLVILYRAQIMEGMYLFWNQLADTWTANSGWMHQKLELQLSEQLHDTCITLFSAVTGCLGAVFCCFFSTLATKTFAVILPALLLSGSAVFQCEVTPECLLLVLSASVLLLLCGKRETQKSAAQVLIEWILCGTAVCILLAAAADPRIQEWSAGASSWLRDTLHTQKYETEYTTLPEGDFAEDMAEAHEIAPALVVTMTKPEAMYLRGFTASIFENDTWTVQDTKVLAQNKELLYWLNLNEFHPAAQFEAAAAELQAEYNVITVENLGACSQYLYVPFTLQEGLYLQAENLNTGSITDSEGRRTYTYSAVCNEDGLISDVLEKIQSANETASMQYRRAETAYREYVYQNYLQIPPEMLTLLEGKWNAVISQFGYTGELTRQQAEECTLAFLTQCFSANEAAESFELPLETAAGSSCQYATVSVLTLRYYGIPARYAEGYVITDEMVTDAGDSTSITVDSRCAQAWTEIYLDGIGWIPIYLVPGLGEAVQGLTGNEKQNQPEQTENTVKTVPEDVPAEDQNLEEPEDETQDLYGAGGIMMQAQKLLWWLLLLVLLLTAFLAVRRKLLLYQKEQRFRDENKSIAVAWIFADAALLLEQMGFDRNNGSMLELCGPTEECFGAAYAQELRRMVYLNGQAMFSSRRLEWDQWKAAMEFRNTTLDHLKEKSKWGKRLWMKWIRCLY